MIAKNLINKHWVERYSHQWTEQETGITSLGRFQKKEIEKVKSLWNYMQPQDS